MGELIAAFSGEVFMRKFCNVRFWATKYRILGLCILAPALSGCETIGSEALREDRPVYNEAVADTGRQQTLMNIVRVHHNQTPVFVEVLEVDDTRSFTGNATGGVAGIGAAVPNIGSATGALTYSQNPILRLQPLQGQQLIQQISTPIGIDTLGNLFDSDWGLSSILQFSVDRLTPGYGDYDESINELTELDDKGAIIVAPVKSDYTATKTTQPSSKSSGGDAGGQNTSASDSLGIYFEPRSVYSSKASAFQKTASAVQDIWRSLLRLYEGTQPSPSGKTLAPGTFSPRLELRAAPLSGRGLNPKEFVGANLAPILRTRSALGVLKAAVESPGEFIDFVTPNQYNEIRSYYRNQERYLFRCSSGHFYIIPIDLAVKIKNIHLDEFEKDTVREVAVDIDRLNNENSDCLFSIKATDGLSAKSRADYFFNQLKEYILIIQNKEQPSESFVSWYEGGVWFYIAKDDDVSQKNLLLMNQFLTIQATQTASPTLTTISVGGR